MIPAAWTELPAPQRLSAARLAAWQAWLALGLPHKRLEEWRYTSLEHLARQALHPAASGLAPQTPGLIRCLRPLHEEDLGALPALAPRTALERLNAALWREGALIELAPGQHLAEPLLLSFQAPEADAMLHPRTRVRLGEGAQAVLVEDYACAGDPLGYWRNPVTEIELAAGANLIHLRLTDESTAATHTGLTAVILAERSRYALLDLGLGGRVCRHELHLRLAGAGAIARLDGLFLADGRRHCDHHLRVEHAVGDTTSRTRYRGIASGRGRGVFDAQVVIRTGADGADARQDSRNLLLSPQAEIDAKPQLMIHADRVQASHGATVGRLADDALYYLRTRGIAAPAARRLLIDAFAAEALGLIDESGLQAALAGRVQRRLASLAEAH
ncbi:MAG: Fe-S cluster assembly protein SufD [Thiobacillaceae bacterium]|nr:Fe-S cluster assembly protein SufD [Thiobacillaceae bacterium]MDW8324819.1 Fe-S cluster assembly protein SufD [Burkholderiales bacterium]